MLFYIRKFGDSQALPACPSDKSNNKMKTSKEHWWILLLVAGLLPQMNGFQSCRSMWDLWVTKWHGEVCARLRQFFVCHYHYNDVPSCLY